MTIIGHPPGIRDRAVRAAQIYRGRPIRMIRTSMTVLQRMGVN